MYLERLSLVNFKNYEQAGMEFSPKINCLVGRNGVGKTNILDAIHYLSLCKSYFNTADTQNIRYGEDFFMIQGDYLRKEMPENIYCGVKRGQKKILKRNRKEYERFSEHIGFLPVIMISPSDTTLIQDGSEERRRFINEVISQYDHTYLNHLVQYNRVLQQRNALLKICSERNTYDADSMEAWNQQLVHLGNGIHQVRTRFCTELIPIFQKYYDLISEGSEKVDLAYQSQLNEQDFADLLRTSADKDRAVQYTTSGIHRDDLQLIMNGNPIRRCGSQGQQKTYLLALKLANFEFICHHSQLRPILLLDDIFDKFDSFRVQRIIALVSDQNFGQIFITHTEPQQMMQILHQIPCDHRIFDISSDGQILATSNAQS
jgi:DNA replication and repair protein RecF